LAKTKKPLPDGMKVLVRNKRAGYDYELSERYEAGLVLLGSEVKALREAKATIQDGYIEIRKGEAWLINVQIQPYSHSQGYFAHEPLRKRKLLLHRHEIKKIDAKFSTKGYSLIPTALILKNGKIKLEFAVGRGKREFEKRQAKRKTESQREIDRAMKR
jgi:SsrA-binding protein